MADDSEKQRFLRRNDNQIFIALIEEQRVLLRRLQELADKLSGHAGHAYEHAAGFEHKVDHCQTCAAWQKIRP